MISVCVPFLRLRPAAWAVCFAGVLGPLSTSELLGQSIEIPAPRAATNAALHYQRAVLLLGSVDASQREILEKPIWEIVTPESTPEELAELSTLLIVGRHAIRAALVGAEQQEADFGLDLRQHMLSSRQPHIEGMKQIGRMVALHGMQLQSQGDWKSSAETYIAGLRMGRQMARQCTLDETLTGVEILETMYFSLANWAVRCPEQSLVSDVASIVDAMANDMVNPARTMRFEAAITKMRLDAMAEAFPNGPWAEMILESLGSEMPAGDNEAMRKAAIEAAGERGVAAEAFASEEAFLAYLAKIRDTYAELARESAACLTKPAPESIKCGQATFAKYEDQLPATERLSGLNPARVAALFAVHKAELDILRQVLAICSAKTVDGYPKSVPGGARQCPLEGTDYEYALIEDGKGFSLKVGPAKMGEIEFPEIEFRHVDAE